MVIDGKGIFIQCENHAPGIASSKSVCGAREEAVECRMKLINNVRGWLRGQLGGVGIARTAADLDIAAILTRGARGSS
jgi:hypothetical protein